MSAYQKEDGNWYVLQEVDKSTKVERLATETEIPEDEEPKKKVK